MTTSNYQSDRAENYNDALRIFRKNTTRRYREIDNLERYIEGTQYEGKADFWTGSDVPLHERAPCIRYPLPRNAIRSHVAMALGEGRWPEISSHPAEDDESTDATLQERDARSLSAEDSQIIDKYLLSIIKSSRLKTAARKVLASAMKSKTGVSILCVRKGRLSIDETRAKWCTPKFLPGGDFELESLEIRYPYIVEEKNKASGVLEAKVYLYRRVIDGLSDITYLPLLASEQGDEPDDADWVADKSLTFFHHFGFCPVIWYPYRAQVHSTEVFDGHAIHEASREEVDALNMALSQRHRAAFYSGDPQMVETGVAMDHAPSTSGRAVVYVDKADHGYFMGRAHGPGESAQRKGAGIVWRYPDAESKVEMLTLPGDALKSLDDNCRDLRAKLLETFSVVFMDPENVKYSAEISGKALSILFARQIADVDETRDDFGEMWLLPTLSMMLRITALIARRGEQLLIRGFNHAAPILSRFEQTEAEETARGEQEPPEQEESPYPHVDWIAPEIDLIWGPYFPSDAADERATVELSVAAKNGGLVTPAIAIEKIQRVFNIKSATEIAEQLEREQQERTALDHTAMMELHEAGMGAQRAFGK